METIRIARVAVSAATYLIDKPYDYAIPEQLAASLAAGMRVLVPFGRGNRVSEGIVLSCYDGPRDRKLKAVQSVLDAQSVLDPAGLRLALWLRERYFCTAF